MLGLDRVGGEGSLAKHLSWILVPNDQKCVFISPRVMRPDGQLGERVCVWLTELHTRLMQEMQDAAEILGEVSQGLHILTLESNNQSRQRCKDCAMIKCKVAMAI